jgi:predicted nucleotidyltransferase
MNFDITKHTIFLTLHGSHAYGMAREESDVDIKGIAIPPSEYFLGFRSRFDQYEGVYPRDAVIGNSTFEKIVSNMVKREVPHDEKIDSCIYDIKKFCHLAANCNPNIIEVLFTDPKCFIVCTELGEMLLDNRDLFLSTSAKFRFSGYSFSQLKRIKTHRSYLLNPIKNKPTRKDFNLPDRSLVSGDQRRGAEALIRKKINEWILLPDEMPREQLESVRKNTSLALLNMWEALTSDCYVAKETDGEIFLDLLEPPLNKFGDFDPEKLAHAAGVSLGYDTNFLEVLDRERNYRSALKQFNQYQEWKKCRNPARAEMEAKFGFDGKHGSHLVRLLKMAKEILMEGKVIVCRPDAEELLSIRRGEWSYDQLIEWAENMQTELDEFYESGKSPLPRTPDYNKIDKLCQDLVSKSLGEMK